MALHAPVHQAGASQHHWLRDILVIGVVALLTIGAVWALSGLQPFSTTVTTTEAQSLIQYRASERDSWAETSTSVDDALVKFRAGERALP
jgi:hypothetical protein